MGLKLILISEVDKMDVLEKGKLFLFVLFIMPGFISMKIYQLFQPTADRDTSKLLIDVVSYSCINYAFLLVPIYWIEKQNYFQNAIFWYYIFYLFVLIIIPALLPIFLLYLRRSNYLRKHLPHPTERPWDYFFSQGTVCWVLITLKSGKKFGGFYGSKSFASSRPEPEQIYLEKHWALDVDGDFDHELKETLGIIILANDIESIEFIEPITVNERQ